MSLPVKIGLFIIGLLAVLVGVLFYIQSQITPDKVREYLLPITQSTLQREIEFGDIQIGFFSGISVEDLVVKEAGSGEDFIAVGKVNFHYQFLPLLRGKIFIDQILLENPQIEITRTGGGNFNFSDLIPQGKSNRTGGGSPDSPDNEDAGFRVFNLLVKEITIKNGFLKFNDEYNNSQVPYRYTFEKLNFNARDLTFDGAFPIDMSVVINGSYFDMSGRYDISGRSGDLLVQLDSLDLVPFAPYYRDILPGKLGAAHASLKLNVELAPRELKSTGRIILENIDFSLVDIPDATFENVTLSGEYSMNYLPEARRLELSTLLARFNDISFSAEGTWALSSGKPDISLGIIFEELDLRKFIQEVPSGLTKDLQKYSFAGTVDGRIDVSTVGDGLAGGLLKSARFSLHHVQASTEGVRIGASGIVTFSDRKLKTDDFRLLYGDQTILLDLSADYRDDEQWIGQFNLYAEEIDFDKLLNKQADNLRTVHPAEVGAFPPSQPGDAEPGPFNLPLELRGELQVDRMLFRDLVGEQLRANLTVKNNLLQIDSLKARLAEGVMRARGTIDLGVHGLGYSGWTHLDRADLAIMRAGLFPQTGGHASGQFSLESNFSGRGTLASSLKENLQAQGTVNIQNGRVQNFAVLDALASFLGEEDLRSMRFQIYSGEYNLRGRRMTLNGLLDSSRIRLSHKGWTDFEGYLVQQATLHLAPDLLKNTASFKKIATVFSDENGWGIIPLKVEGTCDQPRLGLDNKAIERFAAERIKQETGRKLLERMPSSEQNKGRGDQDDSVQRLLDSTLDKLFGK